MGVWAWKECRIGSWNGTKIVCQIALKRRIQHIHSSHFLVFQISNGCSLWKVASANTQYLLFRGIWHWFFFSILKTLKALEIHPSFHKARATEHCEEETGRGGDGNFTHPSCRAWGWSTALCGGSFPSTKRFCPVAAPHYWGHGSNSDLCRPGSPYVWRGVHVVQWRCASPP